MIRNSQTLIITAGLLLLANLLSVFEYIRGSEKEGSKSNGFSSIKGTVADSDRRYVPNEAIRGSASNPLLEYNSSQYIWAGNHSVPQLAIFNNMSVTAEKELSFSEIMSKAGKSAMRGGTAGAVAMGANVACLMWMRTTVSQSLLQQ